MKNILLLLPLFLVACSGENKSEPNIPDQHQLDSLSSIIDANNKVIGEFIDKVPRVNVVLLPATPAIKSGEQYVTRVILAGHLSFGNPKIMLGNTELPMSGDIATYRVKTSEEGSFTYQGVAKMEVNGNVTDYPFTGSYVVSASAPATTTADATPGNTCPARWLLDPASFPGHQHDYATWTTSTLKCADLHIRNMDSLHQIISVQDSIIHDFKTAPEATMKFDQILIGISPASSVVKPGEEYVAFIYVAAISTSQHIEIRLADKTTAILNGETMKFSGKGSGIQQINGTIFYDRPDLMRDSIDFRSTYFVK
jgi:hypothetical protein